MTNEEAVEVLEDMKVTINIPKAAELQRKRNEAIAMAIEALNCSEIPNNSGTVSRQALLDAFGLSEKTRKYGGDHSGYNSLMLYEIQDVIEGMPSAEPKTGEWIYGEDDSGQDGWTCSECGFFVPWYYDYYGLNNIDFIRDFHTCPHCDAKMLTYTGKEDGDEA